MLVNLDQQGHLTGKKKPFKVLFLQVRIHHPVHRKEINPEVFQLQKLDAHTQMSGGSLPRIEEADRTHEFAEQIPAYPSKTCILSTISELLIFSISQMYWCYMRLYKATRCISTHQAPFECSLLATAGTCGCLQ